MFLGCLFLFCCCCCCFVLFFSNSKSGVSLPNWSNSCLLYAWFIPVPEITPFLRTLLSEMTNIYTLGLATGFVQLYLKVCRPWLLRHLNPNTTTWKCVQISSILSSSLIRPDTDGNPGCTGYTKLYINMP